MSELNYNHLRYFWAVAVDGSLTRTANRLNLSQSALSVQIRKLEARLGHPLFERRNRQLHLTEAGRLTLDHAITIFAVGEDLVETLGETGKTRRAVRVGALATLSRNFQMGFLRPILGAPDIDIILRSGSPAELLQALQSLKLDVVLTNQAAQSDALTPFVSHRLTEQQVSLVGPPARVIGKPTLHQLLAAHPVILPTTDSSVRTGFDALMARLGIRPQIAAEVEDMAMMRLLAREGIGLAVLPPIVVKEELASGLLIEADELPGIVEAFYAITVERRFPNPILQRLLPATAMPKGG
jgi:LysR family transcriptional activator of nhaA